MNGEVLMNPSPNWLRAMPPGPDARVKITEEYARHIARDAYFWAWPLVNMYNRRLFFATIKEMAYVGPLPKFFDELEAVFADAPPLPGEEARYAQVLAVLNAVKDNPSLKQPMIDAAKEAEKTLVEPLFEFRNFGIQLAHNWSTVANGAQFGTDYLTRTAVAKSNILVNAPIQAKYFYQDLDKDGGRLNGSRRYAVTFAKGQTPPVHGFWSLTLYSQYHFFVANEIKRYSVGTKNKDLTINGDGSLTIYVQADRPSDERRTNWLPVPKGEDFSLFMRAYWPKPAALDG
jgi:hypothetical protein